VTEDEACSLANPMFGEIDQHGVGTWLRRACRWISRPCRGARCSRRLGSARTPSRCCIRVLGMDSAEFGRLHDRGVVGA
jgi:2-methylfumaryl-CoA isomerase